jgi:hypothetical protein
MTQSEFFAFVIKVLEEFGIPYMITGSIASMAYGEPRLTLDMDIVVDFAEEKAKKFCLKFNDDFYKDLDGMIDAIRQKSSFNIIHVPSGSKVDFYQVKDDGLSRQMFENRRRESFQENKMAQFSRPEDVIINKLLFYREGQSEKHLRDIRGMLRISGDRFNITYLDQRTRELGLTSVWEELKQELGN